MDKDLFKPDTTEAEVSQVKENSEVWPDTGVHLTWEYNAYKCAIQFFRWQYNTKPINNFKIQILTYYIFQDRQ